MNTDYNHLELDVCIDESLEMIYSHFMNDKYLPTFIDEYGEHCTSLIISARGLWLMQFYKSIPYYEERWDELLAKVQHVIYPSWFSDLNVDRGLVLYYYIKSHSSYSEESEKLFNLLIDNYTNGKISSCEGKLSALLACSVFISTFYFRIKLSNYISPIIKLSDECLSLQNQDGNWNPSKIGYFGFDLYYADSIFTCSLGILAVMHFNEAAELIKKF